jgi:hypothetical protein
MVDFFADADGSHKLILTKTGNGKCLMVIKSPAGHIEEWNLTFSNHGLVLVRGFVVMTSHLLLK